MTFGKYRHHHRPGTAPGTLAPVAGAPFPEIALMAFSESDLVEASVTAPEEIAPYLEKWPVTWVNVDGLGSAETVQRLGAVFSLHPLALEDVLSLNHRAKLDDYGDCLFMILRQARVKDGALDLEQLSLFAGRNFVLTFQERPGDCFSQVRERLRKGGRRVRMSKADYFAYTLADAVIDGYFPVIEHYGDALGDLEDEAVARPGRDLLARVHEVKRALRALRQAVWPMREVVDGFGGENRIVREATRPYLRDCHDHVVQIFDILETCRERAAGLTEIYLSSVSNRMNEIIKVLTIITTIFIPLNLIAGIYGMNFDTSASPWNMPELGWAYGYPAVLALMTGIVLSLLYYFRRKGWI